MLTFTAARSKADGLQNIASSRRKVVATIRPVSLATGDRNFYPNIVWNIREPIFNNGEPEMMLCSPREIADGKAVLYHESILITIQLDCILSEFADRP